MSLAFYRCVVETGFRYSNDCLPDLNVWKEMLDKSPIKYIPQVPRSPALCSTHPPEFRAQLTTAPCSPYI